MDGGKVGVELGVQVDVGVRGSLRFEMPGKDNGTVVGYEVGVTGSVGAKLQNEGSGGNGSVSAYGRANAGLRIMGYNATSNFEWRRTIVDSSPKKSSH
jgi:hypothetical protein